MKNRRLMRRIGEVGLLFAAVVLLCIMPGCSDVKNKKDAGTYVSDGFGNCTVYIIEKDGYKFAVAVGDGTCAICQIKEELR